ncbi:MAG: DUF2813 domain-containing protein [Deltaproteobacteria bacterium]|nr:DUF2813 domain-containing protein [Deltaproteobacteria bacterium]
MILKKVQIKNFRCFRDVEVDLMPTTVLIGENNSGKTSFLDAIRLCLSRTATRRGGGLEDYDYHLSSNKTEPEQTGVLAIILNFVLDENEPDDLVQALGDVVVFDDGNVRHIILRISSGFDPALKDFSSDWDFLDTNSNPLGPKTKRPQLLTTFLQLTPVFYLSALRDAAREFHGRSAFWSPFLRNPGIPDDIRERLQAEINLLNNEVLKAHAPLQAVKTHLAKVQEIMAIGKGGAVDIEALPTRIMDLLNRAQVNITAPTGAPLPLARHGSGTQSLAVIFLFEAFFATMLSQQYDPLSRPLLALEEPEAHLHPCAVRSLWASLGAVAGQKIIATHSGDLLSRVPLTAIRRFCREKGAVVVRAIQPGMLTTEEQLKIDFHLQSCRGELLFSRCWLLGEGESEYWVFREAADILGYDLDRLGVRFVNTRYSGVELLLKVASKLGIGWYFVGDGDVQGRTDAETCQKYLQGEDSAKHISILPQANVEVLLCESGFGHIYESHISAQKKHFITTTKGDPMYWQQVVSAQPKKDKPSRIREVMADMRIRGAGSVPHALKTMIEASIAIGEVQS